MKYLLSVGFFLMASGALAAPVAAPVQKYPVKTAIATSQTSAPQSSSTQKTIPQKPASQKSATPPATIRFVIKAPQEAQLSSQMSGKLLRFLFQNGATFRKGDRLAEFDCNERQALLEKANASKLKAEQIEASQKQLRNLKAISDLEYDIARAGLREANADVTMAQAQVSQCYVTAPYAGRVVKRIANQYENMTPGTPLLQIVESGTLRIDLLVPSQWLRWLKQGTQFDVQIDELNTTVKAKVVSLGARVDPASQTIDIRAEFMGTPQGLLPGMSGTADFGVH